MDLRSMEDLRVQFFNLVVREVLTEMVTIE